MGLPQWSPVDQAFAKKMQEANGVKIEPLVSKLGPLSTPESRGVSTGGGSDDIGDIMWTVPTITIRYPSNIPNAIGHNVQSAIAMATPIAHKGVVVGAKAVAYTVLDMLTNPKLIADAKKWQQDVQFKDDSYDPLLTPDDKPAIHLNTDVMNRLRPQMEKFYYDSSKYSSYLEQLGIDYATAAGMPATKP